MSEFKTEISNTFKIPDKLEHDCDKCLSLCCIQKFSESEHTFSEYYEIPNYIFYCRELNENFGCKSYNYKIRNLELDCEDYSCYGAGELISEIFIKDQFKKKSDLLVIKEISPNQIIEDIRYYFSAFSILTKIFENIFEIRNQYKLASEFKLFVEKTLSPKQLIDAKIEPDDISTSDILKQCNDKYHSLIIDL